MEHTLQPPTQSSRLASTPDAVDAAHGRILRPTPELAEAMNRGYEPHDISLRGLFIFLFTLAATLLVVLAMIYGIMMALVDHDRSHDPLGTPVSITRPETYAPLQPSVGHNAEDWQDMATMRSQVQVTLNSSGVSSTGRRYIPVAEAMDKVLPLLVVQSSVKPYVPPTYPKGSIEGRYTGPAVSGPGSLATNPE